MAVTCARPGCLNPPRPQKDLTRRKPLYCTDHDNSAGRTAAWRERKRASRPNEG